MNFVALKMLISAVGLVETSTGNIAVGTEIADVVTNIIEPFVVPKNSLSGDSTERVDTRVLQVIYRIEDSNLPLFVGQQMDVFIDGGNQSPPIERNVSL